MSQSDLPPSPASHRLLDTAIVLAFFAVMFLALRPHVPSHDPLFVAFWAGLAAACMTSVFWLATRMFRVVLQAQKNRRR